VLCQVLLAASVPIRETASLRRFGSHECRDGRKSFPPCGKPFTPRALPHASQASFFAVATIGPVLALLYGGAHAVWLQT
jgi:hypothetical protein